MSGYHDDEEEYEPYEEDEEYDAYEEDELAARGGAVRSSGSLSASSAAGVLPESSGVFDASRQRSQVAHAASTHRSNRPSFPFSQFKHSVASPTN